MHQSLLPSFAEFFKELRSLANENDFLLIYDEVQTGVGITGEMWAHQLFTSKYFDCECEIAADSEKTNNGSLWRCLLIYFGDSISGGRCGTPTQH